MRITPLAILVAALAGPGLAAQVLPLPPRSPSALTGSQILAAISNLSVSAREAFLWQEVTAGNVPTFLRTLVPVQTTAVIAGRTATAMVWAAPDYLGVGSDQDWFRMPMTPVLAQQIATRLQCTMPTRLLVDAIWTQSIVKTTPVPFSPSSYNILSPQVFWLSHQAIEGQLAGRTPGSLVGGAKKDVVISPLIGAFPTQVVIYGWHQPNGQPIQPLSKVHGNTYADYSHGIRLVQQQVLVDGQPSTVAAVLADATLHVLLSDEGAFTSSSYPTPAPPKAFPCVDPFAASGLALAWQAKFTAPVLQAFTPSSPYGDGTVVRIQDPAGGTESLRVTPAANDHVVQADLYCDYRPDVAADGYERLGLFVRDQAQGAFVGTNTQPGACYALLWDSDDGRLRCAKVAGGAVVDLLPVPVHLPSTAWRRLRVEATGSALAFLVDGAVMLRTSDSTFASGDLGIGYREAFQTNALARGTRADNFFAHRPGALTLAFTAQAPGAGTLDVTGGAPLDLYLNAWTPVAGRFPLGPWYGIEMTAAQVAGQAATGHPWFLGQLDAQGGLRLILPFGLPSGLTLYGVTIEVGPWLNVVGASAPVQVALL